MHKVKRPFQFKGDTDRGRWNGVVRKGWKVDLSPNQAKELMRKGLVTKEDKRAYIVHAGSSWYEVHYDGKSEKVQGKSKAEELRDRINADS